MEELVQNQKQRPSEKTNPPPPLLSSLSSEPSPPPSVFSLYLLPLAHHLHPSSGQPPPPLHMDACEKKFSVSWASRELWGPQLTCPFTPPPFTDARSRVRRPSREDPTALTRDQPSSWPCEWWTHRETTTVWWASNELAGIPNGPGPPGLPPIWRQL